MKLTSIKKPYLVRFLRDLPRERIHVMEISDHEDSIILGVGSEVMKEIERLRAQEDIDSQKKDFHDESLDHY